MKWICFVFSVFIGLRGFGQSPVELDKSNGFNEFTIGTKLTSIEKKLKLLDEGAQTKLFKARQKS
jgi:hypothetical protein